MGEVLSSSQVTAGNTYNFSYVYNAAGSLGCETYPSGRTVVTWYDGANRPAQVAAASCPSSFSTLPSGTPAYVSGSYPSGTAISYAANSAPASYYYGNNLTHTAFYNSRLQLGSYTDLVNHCTCDELLNVTLTWANSSGANNGNLQTAVYNNGGPGYPAFLTFSDAFGYDGVNRLTTATDQVTANGVTSSGWSRSFGYDSYGNMTPSGNPAPPAVSFNGNNQLVGQSYDQAGNLLQANGNTLGFDYEGRVSTETDGVSQAVETYVYDGNGQRVEKYNSGTKTVFVYDAFGKLAADYSTTVQTPACVTCYVSSDHLGTARLITDAAANVVARHDYLPFGEEVQANAYGRDSHWGPYNDSINQKFTEKERDSESGLDYFGARNYGSALGRWTIPDESLDGTIMELPQTWNKYSYEYNRPLYGTDPDGRCPPCIGALVGGVIEGGFDLGKQLYNNGGNLSKVSPGEVGASFVGGAVAGAIAGATGGASIVANALIGDVVAGTTGNLIGGVVTRTLDPNTSSDDVLSFDNVSEDALSGFVGGAAGHVASEFVHVPLEPTHNGRASVGAVRRDNAKFAKYKSTVINQITRAAIAGSAATHTSNGIIDSIREWLFNPTSQGPHATSRITSCTDMDGNPCQ